MPLVNRKISSATKNYGVVNGVRSCYVPPGELKPGDVVIEPTRRQRAELAMQYPEEFGEGADAAKGPKVPNSHDKDPSQFTEAQLEYLTLNAEKAIALVKGAESTDGLVPLHDAELRRTDGPRKTVIAAFHGRGVGSK